MKTTYFPIVFIQESEETEKVIDMLEEGDKGLENALRYLRQWEEGTEEGTNVIPYGCRDNTYWIDTQAAVSYVIAFQYGLYISLTRVVIEASKAS